MLESRDLPFKFIYMWGHMTTSPWWKGGKESNTCASLSSVVYACLLQGLGLIPWFLILSHCFLTLCVLCSALLGFNPNLTHSRTHLGGKTELRNSLSNRSVGSWRLSWLLIETREFSPSQYPFSRLADHQSEGTIEQHPLSFLLSFCFKFLGQRWYCGRSTRINFRCFLECFCLTFLNNWIWPIRKQK